MRMQREAWLTRQKYEVGPRHLFGDEPDDIEEILHKGHDIDVFNKYTSIEQLGADGATVGPLCPEPKRYSVTEPDYQVYLEMKK